MKKLLILTAVVMLTGSSVGCRACRWLWRGDANPCAPLCAPACPPDSACPPPAVSDPGAVPQVQPGPASYAPAISQ